MESRKMVLGSSSASTRSYSTSSLQSRNDAEADVPSESGGLPTRSSGSRFLAPQLRVKTDSARGLSLLSSEELAFASSRCTRKVCAPQQVCIERP